ncbi:hypothetical protein ACS0TY_012074 [Phlomoides rotata]
MENSKVLVYNKTKVHLKFKAGNDDLKEIGVGAGQTKTIHFGNLLNKNTQRNIHVLSGEQVLKVIDRHDFPDEEKELLVFEMVDGHLQYSFLHWIWSNLYYPELAVLIQYQRYTEKLKSIVDNKTELDLKLVDYYQAEGVQDYQGSKVIEVPARGRKTIRSGTFLKAYKAEKARWGPCTQKIHVFSGDHLLLILEGDEFQNNQGKELVLDMQDDLFGYAFIEPTKGTSWKNWLCFSKIHKSPGMEIFA